MAVLNIEMTLKLIPGKLSSGQKRTEKGLALDKAKLIATVELQNKSKVGVRLSSRVIQYILFLYW